MLAKYGVKKPYTVIVGILLVIILGVISFQNMTTDLLPSMNLPYVVVYTTYVGATPEQVESDVTRPMESAFATLTDIKEITSTSNDNVSIVIMEFNEGANMDTALIDISAKVDQLAGTWDDDIGAPITMKLNPDMLPVAILSVSRDDMDILELSKYVEEELVPGFEAINGVASASASGVIEQKLDVTIEQSRIDILNTAILREVDDELADVEQKLNDAQAQLSDGKRQIARAKKSAFSQIDQAIEAIDQGSEKIGPAIEQLELQRTDLATQRDALQQTITQLELLVNMSDADKAQLKLLEQQLAGLHQQKTALEEQLANAESIDQSALVQQRDDAQAQRDELNTQRNDLQKYIDDLTLLDADALKAAITALEGNIATTETGLSSAQTNYSSLETQRNATQTAIDDLNAQIKALESQTTTPTDTTVPLDTPTTTASEEPANNTPGASTDVEDTPTTSTDNTNSPDVSADSTYNSTTSLPTEATSTEVAATEAAATQATATEFVAIETNLPNTQEPDNTADNGSAWRILNNVAMADEPTLAELEAQLSAAKADLAAQNTQLESAANEITALKAQLKDDNSDLTAKKKALETLESDNENVQKRVEEAKKEIESLNGRIATLDTEIATLDAQIAASGSQVVEGLKAGIAKLDEGIQAIENSEAYKALQLISDPDSLNAQYAAAVQGLAQMDAGLVQLDTTLEKLNQGIIPGGFIEGLDEDTKLSDARAQLEDAQDQAVSGFAEAESQLADADGKLASARSEFYEKRDEALENAGLDGVITIEMVSGIIGAQNFAMPAGYVYDLENDQVLVRVGNKFASLDELKQMKLFSLGLESVDEIRLLDVANVEITDNRADVFTKLNGDDGILLTFEKQSMYSTADVAKSILAHADEMTEEDSHLQIVDLMNQGEYITVIVDSVLDNLISGSLLAILVLLLFLKDIRPTIIVAFSIPLSVVIAFVCMYFSGITLNVLSLSGLGLGIGMLVDNSIVAIENIYRLHDEEGLPLLKSCVQGIQQVSGALFSSTLTTICVFLPVVFVEGIARDLFADIGLTIAFSLLASLLVAMTVVPSMSASLLRKSKPRKQILFGKIQTGYRKLLGGALRFKPVVLLIAIALLVFSGMQVMQMGMSFMPEVNSRQMSATFTPDSEMSTDDQRALAIEIMDDMMLVDGVDTIGLMSGSGGMLASGSSGSMTYYIIVNEDSDRKNVDIVADVDAIALKYQVDLVAQASTMDISAMAGSGISAEITGNELDTLQTIAKDVAIIASTVEGAIEINDGVEQSVPEMRIIVDKEKAIDEKLTTAQVYQFIATKLYGAIEITQVTLDGKELSVYLIDDKNSDLKPEDLEDLEIEVAGEDEDKMVRIGDIAEIVETTSLSSIARTSQRRMVSVAFDIADGYSANLVSRDFEAKLAEYDVPEGYAIALAGENESVMAIMEDLVWMIVVAIALIFLIMVAQFQSFKSPIIVMFTIPLAFTGGLLALLITGMDLSIVSMLGFLVLAGVVVNNGIVFIDCVNQLRIGGMHKRDALFEAGRQRLRPILMTSLTTILGMSTMALARGTGAEMMQPMAIVSIGGLIYSTLMTLFVVPVMYDLFNGEKLKTREIQMIREAAGMVGDEVFDSEQPAQEITTAQTTLVPQEAPAVQETLVKHVDTPVAPTSSEPTTDTSKRVKIQFTPRKKPSR